MQLARMHSMVIMWMMSRSVRRVDEGTIASTTYLLLTMANRAAHGRESLESISGRIANETMDRMKAMKTPNVSLKNVTYGLFRSAMILMQTRE